MRKKSNWQKISSFFVKNKIKIPIGITNILLVYYFFPNNLLYYQKEYKYFIYNTIFKIKYFCYDKGNVFASDDSLLLKLYTKKINYITDNNILTNDIIKNVYTDINTYLVDTNNITEASVITQYLIKKLYLKYIDLFFDKENINNFNKIIRNDNIKEIYFLYLIQDNLKSNIIISNINFYIANNYITKFPRITYNNLFLENLKLLLFNKIT